ncbi:polysaccharide deacetylase family protein [Rhodoplanes sp. TEM]|uniref:Chitooligosaccharide deacetylase n=1 Tax=Rhodoplanes tepidamans TaxID=200616 RepID=A0ABT5JDB4_RHOTP|nr:MULTISPECIES: polysaccharide deacetylase family protein [Rhodoplanes]MDC7787617.1 polysaccharide deacetylase family protein [Rhodoplanes tepidamans]MDC7984567.1 polysaccharide deacetylase family protein [Rhodoplanes sp. TEM]MDQ0355186.1 peptidoglycan/xylan/chitin deacetylase (PgdA/CDA1 family) [Rhodoplanes tepidamans]
MRQRDLVGYGGRPPAMVWPNGARVAVSLVVNFEEGAELAVGDGDEVSERIGEVVSVVAPGRRDLGQEEMFAYGTRVGLWRFLDAFDRHDRRATFYMCGRAVERLPDLAAEIVARGHEPACHGWLWRPHADFADRAAERASLVRCIDVIRAATGERPLGFCCRGSQSVHTRELLAELGFAYDSNGFDDDLPYMAPAGAGRILVVPYGFDCNDMKFFHPNGFVEPDQFVRYAGAALSTLLDEAERGRSSLLNIGLHLRICGRPARFAAVEGILGLLARLGDRVWVARRIDLARHWMAATGPDTPQPALAGAAERRP